MNRNRQKQNVNQVNLFKIYQQVHQHPAQTKQPFQQLTNIHIYTKHSTCEMYITMILLLLCLLEETELFPTEQKQLGHNYQSGYVKESWYSLTIHCSNII